MKTDYNIIKEQNATKLEHCKTGLLQYIKVLVAIHVYSPSLNVLLFY